MLQEISKCLIFFQMNDGNIPKLFESHSSSQRYECRSDNVADFKKSRHITPIPNSCNPNAVFVGSATGNCIRSAI
jgi:hypothetical protein